MFPLLELHVDLIEEVLQRQRADLKNLAQCNHMLSQMSKPTLWSRVVIPWKCLTEMEWENPIVIEQLANLKYARSLTFYHSLSDLDKIQVRRQNKWIFLDTEHYFEPFTKVLSYCDAAKVTEFKMVENEELRIERGGAFICHVCSTFTNLRKFTRQEIYELYSDIVLARERERLEVTERSKNPFLAIRNLEHLEELDLSVNYMNEYDQVTLFCFDGLQQLKVLNLYMSNLKLQGLDEDPDNGCALNLPNLEELNLYQSNCFDDADCIFQPMASLKSLDISYTSVTDEGVRELLKLGNLEFLFMESCGYVTGVGIEYLSNMNSLRMLNIAFTRTTDEDLAHLRRLKRLEGLSVQKCGRLTDACVKFIIEIESLVYLNVDATITSFNALKILVSHPTLKRLGTRKYSKKDLRGLGRSGEIEFRDPAFYSIIYGDLWRREIIEKLLA